MRDRIILLATQIYIHIMFFYGLFLQDSLLFVASSILITHVIFVGLCGTVYYHRVITHKNPINATLNKILLFISWIGGSGSVIGWAATHRSHHRYSDTPKDPHSPKYSGYFRTYWWSSARAESIRLVPDLLRNKLFVWQHNNYFIGLAIYHILIISTCSFTMYWALCVLPAFMMWFAGSMINVLSHDKDGPRNSPIIALLFAGEGWHKNHHDVASDAKFGDILDLGHRIYQIISFASSQKNTH